MILVWDNGEPWSAHEVHFYDLDGGYTAEQAECVLNALDPGGFVLLTADRVAWRAAESEKFSAVFDHVCNPSLALIPMLPKYVLTKLAARFRIEIDGLEAAEQLNAEMMAASERMGLSMSVLCKSRDTLVGSCAKRREQLAAVEACLKDRP